MAVVTLTATQRPTEGFGTGIAGNKVLASTLEVGAADSTTSTYTFGQIPSHARILSSSVVKCDDVGGATTAIKVGLFGSNITNDDDALNTSISLATAATTSLLADHANTGKHAWEFVAGQSVDPCENLTVKATLITAATDAAGTLTLELYYVV